MKALCEGLPEFQRAKVIDFRHTAKAARHEGAALHGKRASPLFDPPPVVKLAPAILHAIQGGVEVTVRRRTASDADLAGNPAVGIPRTADRCVVVSIDGPVIRLPEYEPESRAIPNVWGKKPALAGQPLERLLEHREVENRHFAHSEDAAVNGSGFTGSDRSARRAHRPPGIRGLAIGDIPVVDRVVVRRLVNNFTVDIEGVVGGEHPEAALVCGGDRPVNPVESADFGSQIIVELLGVQVFPLHAVAIAHVAAGLDVIRLIVVIHLVGGENGVVVVDFNVSAQISHLAQAFLAAGVDLHVSRLPSRPDRLLRKQTRRPKQAKTG